MQSSDELALGENEEEAKMQKGRQFVYQELVATEKDYIRDLECVVNVSVLLDHFRGLKYLSYNANHQRVKPEIPVIQCESPES